MTNMSLISLIFITVHNEKHIKGQIRNIPRVIAFTEEKLMRIQMSKE